MHYVIIGNGVAGINAANRLRNLDDEAEITIISYESKHHFSRTALMYVFCGQLSEQCVEPFERDHYEKMGFKRIHNKVVSLDVLNKKLQLKNGQSLTYDKLLIASGSVPVMFDWKGADLEGVGNFVLWSDLEWLLEKAKTAKKAVVVGGGLIGIETAEILQLAGIQTTFLIRESHYWPVALDENEGTIVCDHMKEHGIDVRLKTEMQEILGDNGKVTGVKTSNGETIDADLVLIAIGVRPQTDWLADSGLNFDDRGGIIVDEQLQTNLENVYAAGDCTSVVWFNDVRRPEQLWYTSRDQGLVAGENLFGLEKNYKRGIFYNSAKFFDIEYTTAGYVNFNFEDEQNWYQKEEGKPYTVRVTYLPDKTVIGFNMLGRRWNHTILVQWIAEKRKLDWVLKHLNEANYDEELMSPFQVSGGIS
ncbi:MAG: NAD(P)/FAD-dependent oxidoreductase [Calditrichaeota bacterium]|nr:MAG: NAD(P)/FAD-dependent oxidoreductase [Calditrichota bacterium]